MRTVLVAAVTLCVGLVLGGLRPRAEARLLSAQIEELEDRECRSLLGSEIVRAVQRAAPPAAPASPDLPPAPEIEAADEGGTDPDDLAEGRAILAARRAQARAALVEDVEPSAEELDRFDAAVADMNADLRALGEDLLARVREIGGPPPNRELMLFAADGLDVLLEADARIRDVFGDEADPEALDPLSHVDPGLVDLLIELDGAGFDP